MTKNLRENLWDILSAALGSLPAVFFVVRDGLGITPDSVFYMQMAQNIASLKCISCLVGAGGKPVPIQHWPPGYPLVIAVLGTHIPAVLGGFLTLLLLSIALRRIGIKGKVARGVVLLLVGVSPVFLEVFTHAWSENVAIPLLLAAILLAVSGRVKHSVFLFSVLPLIRYAFLSFSFLNLLHRGKRRLLYLSISLLPFLLWRVYLLLYVSPHSPIKRELALHPPSALHWTTLSKTILAFFGLHKVLGFKDLSFAVFTVALFLLAVALLFIGYGSDRLVKWSVSGAIVYLAFLMVSITLYDYASLPDYRLMSPVFFLLLPPFVKWISQLRRTATYAITLILATGYALHAKDLRVQGYNQGYWKDPQAVLHLKRLKGGVYSNAPDAVWYISGVGADMVPRFYDINQNRPNPSFKEEMEDLKREFSDSCRYLVWVKPKRRGYLPSLQFLLKVMGESLHPLAETRLILVFGSEGCEHR